MPPLIAAAIAAPALFTAAATAGTGITTAVLSNRAQGNASKRANAITTKTNADALAYQREQDALQRQQSDQQQAEAKRQWDAEEAFRKAQFASTEEERLHARSLLDAREARAMPYRAASQSALLRMQDLLNSGAATPGIARFQRPLTMGTLLPRG